LHNHCGNCKHLSSWFLPELPQVCDPFFAALAVCTKVVRPLAYHSLHSMICQRINLN
jgi:hypothetical protein